LLRQEAADKLSLDHPISRYVAGLPDSASINWSKITIRSLLSHLGGIPDNCKQLLSGPKETDFVPSLTWIFLHRRTLPVSTASHRFLLVRSPVCQSARHSQTIPSHVPKRVSGFQRLCNANRSKSFWGFWPSPRPSSLHGQSHRTATSGLPC
jgi:hypothetical protein